MVKRTLFVFIFVTLLVGSVLAKIAPLPAIPPIPKNNTMNRYKVMLGKMLFFDPRLSKSNWISCATCHNPALGFTDRIPRALGHDMAMGPRNTPTILNAAFLKTQFWDGRAKTLEEQALGPIQASVEMNSELSEVIRKLNLFPKYVHFFKKAFPEDEMPLNKENLAKAIASYERTLITPDAPIDRYLSGDLKALTPKAVEGFKKFKSLGCGDCHSGSIFSDGDFHKIKIPASTDTGRYNVTHVEADRYKFRTPTLRNIELTWPYMNDGSIESLEKAVKIMGKIALEKNLDSNTVKELTAFLKSLTGKKRKTLIPNLP